MQPVINVTILECGPGATTSRVDRQHAHRSRCQLWLFRTQHGKHIFSIPPLDASAAAKRYYFHKRTWINDVDHICMDALNNQQSEAAATLIAMSGGNAISGDRLTQLDTYKLDILKKITPSFGEAATPVDLFDDAMQSVFALKVKKPFADLDRHRVDRCWFFQCQPDRDRSKRNSHCSACGWSHNKTYLAFDFWKQQFIGELTDEIKVSVQPGSVVLLTAMKNRVILNLFPPTVMFCRALLKLKM